MRRKRLILGALVTLGLAPGTLIRPLPPPRDYDSPVLVEALPVEPLRSGPFALESAWRLSSENDLFGGYSALILRPDGRFLAASDGGWLMVLPRLDQPSDEKPKLGIFTIYSTLDKRRVDIESLAMDPDTGMLWAGYEWANAIERYSTRLIFERRVEPLAMKGWRRNSGPESLARLADGRFLVISEGGDEDRPVAHRALLFAGDPTEGGEPVRFSLIGIEDYRPVEATPLPDGRALVLFRKVNWGFPPEFQTAIAIIDPSEAKAGSELRAQPLAFLGPEFPQDNYEGMTVTTEADGTRHVWLLSDDNNAAFQQTLVLKLRWEDEPSPNAKRRAGIPARP